LVQYRLFIGCHPTGKGVFEKLKTTLAEGQLKYNLSLGTANFSGYISQHLCTEAEVIYSNEVVDMHSAVVSEGARLDQAAFSNLEFIIEEDTIPLDFVANNNRELADMRSVLFSGNAQPLKIYTESPFFRVNISNQTINFQFIE